MPVLSPHQDQDLLKVRRTRTPADPSRTPKQWQHAVFARSIIERNRSATPDTPDKGVEDKDAAAKLVDELLTKPIRAESEHAQDPLAQTPQVERPSETISEKSSPLERGTTKARDGLRAGRESVRAKIKEIDQARKNKIPAPANLAPQMQHQQPNTKGIKSKQVKGR